MDIFNALTLFGGLAMFLYGMRTMGDALKESSSGTLKNLMEKVTNNPLKAFLLGVLVTALIQSSTATIVITSGLVGAGILSLHQSLGIIIGANVGTTVTGQIIRLLGVDGEAGSLLRLMQPSSLAPIALIIGIILIMSNKLKNSKSVGNILIGFGVLFSGLMNMTSAVDALQESGIVENIFTSLGNNPVIGYLSGAGVAFVLQSSSATIGILQAFSRSGLLSFKAVYAVIVGVYLGDCVTTFLVCAIGADSEPRRVGIVNILFNLSKSVLILAGVIIVHKMGLIDWLWDKPVDPGIIANANTVFNLSCALLLVPFIGIYEKLANIIVKDKDLPAAEDPYKDKLDALNPVFFSTPALALKSSYDILNAIFEASKTNIVRAFSLLREYDESVHDLISSSEDDIDRLTDNVSKYNVQLLPNLANEYHVSILDQYYKVTAEFERLGDHAVNIAKNAKDMYDHKIRFSDAMLLEIAVLEDLLLEILDKAETTFKSRDVKAAYGIEPLVQVTSELLNTLKAHHLERMIRGECNIYSDANFTNLINEFQRIADVCSNVGVATVVRVNPEIADKEHYYYAYLHSGDNAEFNEAYNKAHDKYFLRMHSIEKAVDVKNEPEEVAIETNTENTDS